MENLIEPEKTLLLQEETYLIRGAIFEVYKEIGSGFLEAVYQQCLEREFTRRQIPFQSQPDLSISYKGETLNLTYKPDFVCYGKILIELKAVKVLVDEHRA